MTRERFLACCGIGLTGSARFQGASRLSMARRFNLRAKRVSTGSTSGLGGASSQRVLFVVALGMGLLMGCSEPQPSPTGAGPVTVDAVLDKMITTYRDAVAYSDRAYVKLQIKDQEQWQEQEENAHVAWMGDDRVAVRTSAIDVVCNGEKWYASISPKWRDLDGQVVVRDAPDVVSFTDLYQDPVIKNQLMSGLGPLVQLELLLSDQPLAEMLAAATSKEMLPAQPIEGHSCHRVELVTAEGSFVLWIDRKQYLLRRLELPRGQWLADRLADRADAADEEVQWVVEFEQAAFSTDTRQDRFSFDMPPGARRVKAFVTPPKPVPLDLFGKRVEDFTFQTLDGTDWTRAQVIDKQVVLMWFNIHPASQFNLEQLETVFHRYRENPDWEIYAVFAEPSRVSREQLQQVLADWNITMPVLLDTNSVGRDEFLLSVAPAVVVLNRESVVQTIIVERDESLGQQLLDDMERLGSGELLAAENLATQNRLRREYEQLIAVNSTEDATLVALPRASLREPADPELLTLVKLWESDDVDLPLHVRMITTAGSDQRVLVLERSKTVVELGQAGEVLARHKLQVPETTRIDSLQTVSGRDGHRFFAVTGTLAKQVFLLDEQYRHVSSYPPPGQEHDGISDVCFADLDHDATPELYVGFWGPLGVHAVSLEGQRMWSSRVAANVLSLTPRAGAGGHLGALLVSNDRGGVYVLSAVGGTERTITVPGQNVHHLFAAVRGDAVAGYLGIAFVPDGTPQAIGLAASFEEQWSLELSSGPFRSQLVAFGQFVSNTRGAWFVAGSDGTIRIIGQDGKFFDFFSVGSPVAALASGHCGGQPCLLVATDHKLTAWRFDEKAR